MAEAIVHTTEERFDEDVLQAETPVLVDFWAEWCGPCRTLAPLLDDVAQTYGERIRVVKVNIDENQAIAPRFGIRGIPTLMVFKDGAAQATRVGALSRPELAAFVDSNL
ncbi:thioredoxin 1 [Natronocella acetinitrilica]|uniref:Thioredoxin n=1 Tax=Natronocella acetinitrilica TaxID=414046 RepID=A0AAE3G403_9GAMM|nr:thioredoxin TrxA [Natronocella acetinitrilica]MCP1675390.1 thioredoxin 1 [Natronocella acetinitrilica]